MSGPSQSELLVWADQRLAEGGSLAGRVRGTVASGQFAVSLIASGPLADDLRWGRGGPQVWDSLVSRLMADYPAGTLFVELPLMRPDDPDPSDFDTLVCGDEVYATTLVSAGAKAISATLRASDPAAVYVAAVLERVNEPNSMWCPAQSLAAGSAEVVAIVVGAYDGEGFVYCSRGDGRC